MNHSIRAAAGLAAGVLAIGTGPAAAMAAPLSFTHAIHQHARHHGHSHRFNLKGLVTAANGTQLQVLVGKGHLGARRLTGQSVQLDLNARGHHPAPVVGDSIHAQGTAGSAAGEFDASEFEVQAAGDSSALVGVLDAVDGTTLMVNVTASAGPDDQGDQGDGQGDQGNGQGDQGNATNQDGQGDDDVPIDASTASVSLDGQPASLAQLTPGQTVAVLGDTADDSALATQVMAYSTAPGIADGTITQVSGNVLTLSSGDGGDGGDGEDGNSAVDVTSSQIFLDGQSGATVSQLATGDDVLAIGTAGSDPLAATVTFAFDQGGDGQGD
jgi:hypothetical protein